MRNMKKSNLLFAAICFYLCVSNILYAQTPGWLWAKSAGGTNADRAFSLAGDATGNLFVAGEFKSSTLTFGSATLVNSGDFDIFLAKYNASGDVLWAKSAEGINYDIPNSVAADASGNVYLTGRFKSATLTFGSDILTNSGNDDLFFVKYDAEGNVLWAKSIGGINYDAGNSVVTEASGNVYIAGYFSSPTITFGSTTLTNAGTYDMFLAKYDASGNVLWAKSVGGADDDGINSLVADASGNPYVTGYFASPTLTFGSTTLTNAGIYDVFMAKFDAGGNVLWAKSGGGADDDEPFSAAADASGNVYSAGYFSSPTITFGSTTLISEGSQDIFLVKYDSSGNELWAKSAGGTDYDVTHSVVADVSGNTYVTGYFESPAITFGSTTLTSAGNGDVFLAMYDANGNVLWAISTGGPNFDEGTSVVTDIPGNIYCSGNFSSSTITFSPITLTNAGSNDMFLAKLESSIMGINDVSRSVSISIYPNPVSNTITIALPPTVPANNTTLCIYNVNAQQVISCRITEPQFILDIGTLPRGVYFSRITTDATVMVNKFIKQ
jgi:hypothetical protein